ncbi:probable leucine-rich repeat receptor-like protein kinase At5g49770 [Phalaenopsis equestris]|uniref:probable leucine-rich repeat receptor-like protein kinase At5g49770 n=1 Tax=Phalaenopsis equestris TaxID=78828 RepID=UPI0009E31C82|nr:probable leucine-rich repeat receptor-like protein kinase At5g49770 [Phalaenopsis equestris]
MAKPIDLPLLLHLACVIAGLQAGAAATVNQDIAALRALMGYIENMPSGWGRSNDPCGSQPWEGVTCSGSRVTELKLYNMGLRGKLSSDIATLTALKTLDLSYNSGLGGQLTPAVGELQQLESLMLVSCSFSGAIPSELGNLTQLTFLALNSNQFIGTIPASLGSLSKLSWLDLADNQLTGTLPVSNGSIPGLDQLVNTKHFHLNKNRLSGLIPEKLFNSNMHLIHLLLDRNKLDGTIPASIGTVQTLEIIRLDNNLLGGSAPSNINNLTSLHVLNLANNGLIGPMPNLTGLNRLNVVDLSNNSFDPSEAPAWISENENITTLAIESGRLHGQVPQKLFTFPRLQQVILKNNSFNGTLDMGSNISEELKIVNFENNDLTSVALSLSYNNSILLSGNPVCSNALLSGSSYCLLSQELSPTYSTGLSKCGGKSCPTNNTCTHPYEGIMFFRAPYFRDLSNETAFQLLEKSIWERYGPTLGSVSLQNPFFNNDSYLEVHLVLCPLNGTYFSVKDVLEKLDLSGNVYAAPAVYGPFYFGAFPYSFPVSSHLNVGLIVGLTVGCALLVLGLASAAFYAFQQKKRAKKAIEMSNPFATWDASFENSGEAPQLKGARFFSFEELKKCTNNFPEINAIGSGGYGKVYRGILLDGRMVAIKRSKVGSSQGGLEFKTEIELLSRVHHKNLVDLVGFCFQQGERMLVYEYVPNGTLRESLDGRRGIQLNWMRRLQIALDSARGLAYLHELANPPIIHRDIKSANILLDENLIAKVADFGLSKLMTDGEVGHISTQVKGTLGYLDPEYYMTQILTEKSDVYSFGVVMLELITGDPPIHNGKYIVSVVKSALNKNDVYYGLKEIMDPLIRETTHLVGFRRFVELALLCLEESAADRPTMSDVVKEIEVMLKKEGLSADTTVKSTNAIDLYPFDIYDQIMTQKEVSGSSFAYSGSSLSTKLEPK